MLSILSIMFMSSIVLALPIHLTIADEDRQTSIFNSFALYFFCFIISILMFSFCIVSLVLIAAKLMKNK
jgi:hypothetical protein